MTHQGTCETHYSKTIQFFGIKGWSQIDSSVLLVQFVQTTKVKIEAVRPNFSASGADEN